MRIRVGVTIAIFLAVASPHRATAQQADNGWKFTIAPYFLFPHMDGDVAIGPVSTSIDVSPGDIFSNLQFGAMLAAEARNSQWAIGFNGLYMDLSKDGEKGVLQFDGYQAGLELTGFRRLAPWFEILAGGRLNLLGTSIQVAPSSTTFVDQDKAWFDPFLGVRFTVPHTGKWDIMLRGDVGGFGIGSQFAWQIRPTVAYRISKHWSVGAAYWALGMDYVSGEVGDGDYFKYDVTTFGPEIGFGYTF
jgi:hypothetical protein